MAEVTIEVGGRRYDVACRDGEEEQLRRLALIVDEKAQTARTAVGGVNEARQLLLASLLLADELQDARAGGTTPANPVDGLLVDAVEQLADRVEALASHLEGTAPTH